MLKKRATALLLCLVLLLSACVYTQAPQAFAATKQELEQRINQIDEQIKANRSKIDELKNQKAKQQEYLNALQSQIEANQEKIDAVQTQIDAVNAELAELDAQIAKLQKKINQIREQIRETRAQIEETKADIEAQKDVLSSKLRASYITGKESSLKILMGASSLASFLTRLEMMKRTSENDKKTIEAFQAVVKRLQEQKQMLADKKLIFDQMKAEVQVVRDQKQAKKDELSKRQATLKKARAALQSSYNEVDAVVAQLDRNSAVYQNYINKLQSERTAADKEIDRIIREAAERAKQQHSSSGTSTSTAPAPSGGGSWGYPVGGSTYVSSGFGNRSASISGWSFHGGIDIADPNGSGVIYGRPIYASRGGTVITASHGTTGYGNYVIIDHGDGYASLYGHCSSLAVSTGQTVSKGQHIANVGESGNARGAHLHFEIRYNGAKVNPSNYL